MSIREKIDAIVSKYYHSSENYYFQFRYDENEREFNLEEEIRELLTSEEVEFQISFTHGYSSCSYENSFLAVAWVENDRLGLATVLLECY